MADRRTGSDRRARHLIPEPIERKASRRQGDRRDSPRLAATLELDDGTGRTAAKGELGLGGASFTTVRPPAGDKVILRYALGETVLEAKAKVVRREVHGQETTVHVTFGELPLEVELALARWLDGGGKTWRSQG